MVPANTAVRRPCGEARTEDVITDRGLCLRPSKFIARPLITTVLEGLIVFTRILIPTDGSDVATPAITTALDIATKYDATLHALFIVDPPSSVASAGDGFTGLDNLVAELEDEGHEATAAIAAQATDRDIETITAVRRGNPHDDILTYAEAHEIDLIVMGTHGRTGVKRALLGSVTEDVVRHAEIPVLTVHQAPDE
jgi:nucleotide-binding universal stress UspA family protein